MIAVSLPSNVGCRITFQRVFDLTNRVNTVFTYPTLAEAYKMAAFEGLDKL